MDLNTILANATPETIVHLDYVAGREPGEIARQEFADSRDWDKRPTEYVGHFVSLKRNKRGEPVLTLFVHNRGETGKYRAFNPCLGVIRNIRVWNPDLAKTG